MAIARVFRRLCLIAGALMLLTTAVITPVHAQQRNPDGTPDPNASVVNEHTLLRQLPRIEGEIAIPDTRARVLIQPAGRLWVRFHETMLRWVGAIAILGVIAALGLGYVFLGRIRISAGRSGTKVRRFNAFERFSHWLTAVSFVLLGLTGLNITFGKVLLLPLLGEDAFSQFSQASKYVHDFVSFAFVLGLASIVVIWFRDNLPRRGDIDWLMQGGGFLKSRHPPPAGRFNAGEKLVYWLSLAAGIAVAVSGYLLLFPFYATNILGMQLAEGVHGVIAMLFIALILGHIYMGFLGMEGAFEAMGTGEVDLNWAKEHHGLWLQEEMTGAREPAAPVGAE